MKTLKIIGHRGARSLAPENTLPSIQVGIDLGLFGVEFDVTLSKDEIPVLIHQETLVPVLPAVGELGGDRYLELAGRKPARSWVREYSCAELQAMDAGRWHSLKFSGIGIPTLEQVLTLSWGKTAPIIELIDASYWETQKPAETSEARRLFGACQKVFQGHGKLLDQAYFLSFNPWILEQCLKHYPNTPRILAVWEDEQEAQQKTLHETQPENPSSSATSEMLEPDVIKWAGKVQAQAVTLADFMILARPQWVSNLHAQGLEVWAYDLTPDLSQGFEHWNVESRLPVWQALKTIGVDGIESDFPEKTITLMAEMR